MLAAAGPMPRMPSERPALQAGYDSDDEGEAGSCPAAAGQLGGYDTDPGTTDADSRARRRRAKRGAVLPTMPTLGKPVG